MKEHQIIFGIDDEGDGLRAVISDIRCTRSVGISVDKDRDYKFVINIKECMLNPVAYFEDSKEMSAHITFYLKFLFGGAQNCDFWAYSQAHVEKWNSLLVDPLHFNLVDNLAACLGASAQHVETALDAMLCLSQSNSGFVSKESLDHIHECGKHSALTMAVSASICILRFAKKEAFLTLQQAMGANK
jgi:hypothetical protein